MENGTVIRSFEDGSPDVVGPGWRFHMPDLAAAIGRAQLARFESTLKPARLAVAREYRRALATAVDLFVIDLIGATSGDIECLE